MLIYIHYLFNNILLFYSFPKNEHIRLEWVKLVEHPEKLTKGSVLCSQHFTEDLFDRTSLSKVRLIPNAVPTMTVSRQKYVSFDNC